MAQWAVVLPADRYEAERLFHHDRVELPELIGAGGRLSHADGVPAPLAATTHADPSVAATAPAPGDEVLLLAELPRPAIVALGRVEAGGAIAYTRRGFDAPQPAGELPLDGPVTRLEPASFRALAGRLAPPADPRTWLVSVDLPIEAATPAEAVRQFWSYVMQLGPRELPAFVWPAGDELAMQAYVLGEEANQDPEEDDD
jgi:hypothetical protein